MNEIPSGKRGRISQDTVYPRCVLIAKSVLSKKTLETIDSGSDSVFHFCIHVYTYRLLYYSFLQPYRENISKILLSIRCCRGNLGKKIVQAQPCRWNWNKILVRGGCLHEVNDCGQGLGLRHHTL